MRYVFGLLIAAGLVLLAPSKAEARQIRMLDHGLSWGGVSTTLPGASLGGKHQLVMVDEGSGGGGMWVAEGCLSIVTEFAAAFVVALAVGVGIVAGAASSTNGGDPQVAAGAVVTLAIVGALLIPLASSAVVYALARTDGENPSYWKVVLYSIGARLLFNVLYVATKSNAISYVGFFAGAVAEVYAANSGPFGGGSGGDSETRVRMITARPPAVGATALAANETGAKSVSMLSFSF